MRILSIFLGFFFSLLLIPGVYAASLPSVLKIRTYEYDAVEKTFSEIANGSAVYIGNKQIITNAHVIEGSENTTPTGYYEVCFSADFKKEPLCFATAKLVRYDSNEDLALLELSSILFGLKPVTPGKSSINIGDTITVYGYPSIGGNTITRTEGKAAGYEDGSYKIDATIDHGSSGGGAFDSKGEWVGIPRALMSDNGLIGYVIPLSKIIAFQNKKLSTSVTYTGEVLGSFGKNRLEIGKMLKAQKINDDVLTVQNIRKNGFSLVGISKDVEKKMSMYVLSSANKHVNITITCGKTSGTSTLEGIMHDISEVEGNQTRTYGSGTSKNGVPISIVRDEVIEETPDGKKPILFTYFYPTISPACAVLVTALHKEKDAKTISKAESFIKNEVILKKQGPRVADRINITKTLASHVLFSEMNIYGEVDHTFFVRAPGATKSSWISTSGIYNKKYGNMKELFSEGSDSVYGGKDFTWNSFLREIAANYANSETRVNEVVLPDGKKGIIASYQAPDSSYGGVWLLVPYKDQMGKIHAFKISFSFLTKKELPYIQDLRNLLGNTHIPGSPVF